MTRVDIVIPTFNGSEYLSPCLRALVASTYADFNLIVYDDGSTEDIPGTVVRVFPRARVIRSDRNRGLAYGFNRAAAVGTSEFLVLLNNDTLVEPDWLSELVACADRHPHAGSIASKIRTLDGTGRLHSAGDYFSRRGVAGNRGVWTLDAGQFDVESPVFTACGAAALYRRAALDAVALSPGVYFNEHLFMYYEDVDLAWRLQLAGYCCWFAHRAVVGHHISATAGGSVASYFVARNSMWVLRSVVPNSIVSSRDLRAVALRTGIALRTIRHLREPAARATLRGTVTGMIGTPTRHVATQLSASEHVRLTGLLRHSPTSRHRGVPIARLSRPLDDDGPDEHRTTGYLEADSS